MYAIVDIAGKQHKVKKKQKIYVHRLDAAEGSQVEFSKVLLVDNEGAITVGMPFVDGTRVAAKVLAHVKDDKVLVFKKKRRKGYKKLNGHRQYLTQLLIQGILGTGEVLEIEEEEETLEEIEATDESLEMTGDEFAEEDDLIEEEEEEAPKKKKKAAAPKAKKAAAPKKKAVPAKKAKK
jgi:large subunit ribosomal protein L21